LCADAEAPYDDLGLGDGGQQSDFDPGELVGVHSRDYPTIVRGVESCDFRQEGELA